MLGIPPARSKKRVFLSLFLSNLFIMGIIVALGLACFFLIIHQIDSVIKDYNSSLLSKMTHILDERIGIVKTFAGEIASDDEVALFNMAGERLSGPQKYGAFILSQKLESYVARYRFIFAAFLAYENSESIITNACRYPFDRFLEIRMPTIPEDLAREELLGHRYFYDFLPVSVSTEMSSPVTYLGVAITAPFLSVGHPRCTVVFLIDSGIFDGLFESVSRFESGGFYILAEDYSILLSIGNRESEEVIRIAMRNSGGNAFSQQHYGSVDYLVHTIPSGEHKLYYATVIPKDSFYNEMLLLWVTLILFIAGSLVTGVLLAFRAAKVNSIPIGRIYNLFISNTSAPKAAQVNEYDFIESEVKRLLQNEQVTRATLKKYLPMFRQSLLVQLIRTGSFGGKKALYDQLGVSFRYRFFQIGLVSVTGSRFRDVPVEGEAMTLAVTETANNAVEGLNGSECEAILGLEQGTVCLLFNLRGDGLREANHVFSAMVKTREILKEKCGIDAGVGLGNIHRGIMGIHRSYEEAVRSSLIYNFRNFRDGEGVVRYSDISRLKSEFKFPLDLEKSLVSFLKAGDRPSALRVIDRIIATNFADKDIFFELAQCLFFELINTALKVLGELDIDYGTVFGDIYNPFLDLPQSSTVDDMRSNLEYVFGTVCDYISEKHLESTHARKEEILDYVKKKFTDPTMDLNRIASEYNFSATYFSTYFREITGEHFKEHLTRLRIEQAMTLLLDTPMNISDVATAVGYTSEITLYRNFKKIVGSTPSVFRKTATKTAKI